VSTDSIVNIAPLGFPWPTKDPFLTCVHHVDLYPKGNERLGPAASLAGRDIGQDFAGKDGWRMYHGAVVPGFPQHPHRGFETVTVMRDGYIDHSDSLGATARFGKGDVQWLTAGAGIVHSLGDSRAPAPPPDSWAATPDSDVAIWSIALAPGAVWTLPPARDRRTTRTLYFFLGRALQIDARLLREPGAIEVAADRTIRLAAPEGPAELLLLQGRPIGEPVAQYGPFVMNTRAELEQAFYDYQRTQFGGWPFPANDPVHARDRGRFARHADGRVEEAPR
jgi:hypothetical protein